MTVKVILNKMKYLRIHNVSMNELGRIFLNSHIDRRKNGVFMWDIEELTFLKLGYYANKNEE